MSVIIGTDLNGLSTHLGRISPGEPLSLAVVTEATVDQQLLETVTAAAQQSGLRLLAPASYVTVDWEGYQKSAIYLSFVNPEVPEEGQYSFWPVVIMALAGAGALGYFLWKGGEIADTTVKSLVNMVFPLALLFAGVYLVSNYSNNYFGRRD